MPTSIVQICLLGALLCAALGLLSWVSRSYWHAHLAESQAQALLRDLLTTATY
jgi:hypothetical protein